MLTQWLAVFVFLAALSTAVDAQTASPGFGTPNASTLRVAIAPIAPFVLPNTTTPEGFSIDIWNEVARRMHVQFVWRQVTLQGALLPAVQQGDADVAISAITETPDREKLVDFTLPYFDSGLQIMVRVQNDNSFMTTLREVPCRGIGQLVGIAIVIVFGLAIVYDAPTLQYWAGRLGSGSLAAAGPVFQPQKYGIAVATGSPLRKPVNETLLAMYEDGTYEQIYGKWFSPAR